MDEGLIFNSKAHWFPIKLASAICSFIYAVIVHGICNARIQRRIFLPRDFVTGWAKREQRMISTKWQAGRLKPVDNVFIVRGYNITVLCRARYSLDHISINLNFLRAGTACRAICHRVRSRLINGR